MSSEFGERSGDQESRAAYYEYPEFKEIKMAAK